MAADKNQSTLITECARQSEALLRTNLTRWGVLAASPTERARERHYTQIFGRDAAICALGMMVAEDPVLHDGAVAGLVTLAEHQAENGQIPKYVDPERLQADFWYVGCIDATLWWLIAVKLVARHHPDFGLEKRFASNIQAALNWLHCQEPPRLYLLQQNEASDWADIMPRSGFVLYSNALWYYVKRLYSRPHDEETLYHFNHLFFPFSREVPDYRRLRLLTHYVINKADNRDLYLSFVNFSFWGEEGDVFGNLLAILLGLASDNPTTRILQVLDSHQVAQPVPTRAVTEPIEQWDSLWRTYMARHQQNLPYQYHNGGCWPFIGGFHVLALVAAGRQDDAHARLEALAETNAREVWGFNEWFHGKTGEPCGMPGQSWNAALFLLARYGLNKRIF